MKAILAIVASIVLVLSACITAAPLAFIIVSPTGEEVWQAGTLHSVSWESNLPGSSEITILLSRVDAGGSLAYPLYVSDGSNRKILISEKRAQVLVPLSIPRGDWTLAMSTSDGSIQTRSQYVIKVE